MRIAQIAPVWESVPPKLYGGTERVISYLTEELVRRGHDVTLFASGDSTTSARLRSSCPASLRLNANLVYQDAPLIALIEQAFSAEGEFDVIHSHVDLLSFPLARRASTPVLHTLHNRLVSAEIQMLARRWLALPVVAVSEAQRAGAPELNWVATIHHGIPRDLYHLEPNPDRYLVFLSRLSRGKRPDHAIDVAKVVGLPIKLAGKLDPGEGEYFHKCLAPRLADPAVEYLGEIPEADKVALLEKALALLAPYEEPEPFGLTVIEALACGTPVLAYRRGALLELIEHGRTGFLVEDPVELIEAMAKVPLIERADCRRAFEARFTVERMVDQYLKVYEHLVSNQPATGRT